MILNLQMNKSLLTLLLLLFPILFSFGQKKSKLPEDLRTEKVIFFQYEMMPINDFIDDRIKKYYEANNKVFKKTNPELVDAAKEYPFGYAISTRGVYEELEGFKYILDSEEAEQLNNGEFFPERNYKYEIDVFIKNIKTGEKYILFTINQFELIDHKKVMSKLIKLVNKQFELSSK